MRVSIEEKKAEAVARMKELGIHAETVKQFESEGLVSISEPPFGAFFWAEGEDLERIKQFENQHGVLVYMVIRTYSNFGKMDDFLYVSDYREEWAMDRDDLTDKRQIAYTYNHDMPDCSEFGSIGFALTPAAGLIRTW